MTHTIMLSQSGEDFIATGTARNLNESGGFRSYRPTPSSLQRIRALTYKAGIKTTFSLIGGRITVHIARGV